MCDEKDLTEVIGRGRGMKGRSEIMKLRFPADRRPIRILARHATQKLPAPGPIGIEVGCTFTDLVAMEGGSVFLTKVLSTHRSPDVGAFATLSASGIDLSPIEDLDHRGPSRSPVLAAPRTGAAS